MWTRNDLLWSPGLPAGTVATSTGGPLLHQSHDVAPFPSYLALAEDTEDYSDMPPLIDAPDVARDRSDSVPPLTLLPENSDDEDEEFDIFDPSTPVPKRRRPFRSPPPQ